MVDNTGGRHRNVGDRHDDVRLAPILHPGRKTIKVHKFNPFTPLINSSLFYDEIQYKVVALFIFFSLNGPLLSF